MEDPRKQALRMVFYRAVSGIIMVVVYAAFEVATVYIYHWLSPAAPAQVQA